MAWKETNIAFLQTMRLENADFLKNVFVARVIFLLSSELSWLMRIWVQIPFDCQLISWHCPSYTRGSSVVQMSISNIDLFPAWEEQLRALLELPLGSF